MGSSQTLLVLAALTIFGMISISANKRMLNTSDAVLNSETVITGTAIAQAEIEQVTTKRFDQNLPPPLTTDTVSALTSPEDLGPDPGENPDHASTFNDIDDYNGYVDSVNTPRFGYYTRRCSVYYVTETDPNGNAGTRTFIKRIDVTVYSPYMNTPGHEITLSKLVSYRYKG